ncbi:hypothetical protein BH11BAC1_BH11BAC1_13720 [soil metagenome]
MKRVWLAIKWFMNSLLALVYGLEFFNEKPPVNIRPNKLGAAVLFLMFIVMAALIIPWLNKGF